jgi:hypothetical protein
MRNALLVLATLAACRETATSSRLNAPEPARRYGLREDAVGCFKATFLRNGREYTRGQRFFRLDSTEVAWFGYRGPGYRAVWPAASDIVREERIERAWSADSLTDSIRVRMSDGFTWALFVFDLGARDTFAGFEAHGTDIQGSESSRRIVVRSVNCADYRWSMDDRVQR